MIIGLEVRHFKAYKGKKFIPIGNEHNFISYTGENGVGKSSILEALSTFLNNTNWLLSKGEKNSDSYICPVFLIPKNKVTRLIAQFEAISDYFWQIDKKDKNNKFFEIRDSLSQEMEDSNYLIFLGEDYNRELQFPFGDKDNLGRKEKDSKSRKDFDTYISSRIPTFKEKLFLSELKSIYSYVYLPVETDIESFTKIETEEMQKIFDKELKDEIKSALKDVNLDKAGGLNNKLHEFVLEIEEILNNEYCYDTGMQRNNKVTTGDLVDKILEVYFQKRSLHKQEGGHKKMVKELSAGEKRQALINLIYAFISRGEKRDKEVIIGIDEPENSLHTNLCYEQFEKLKKVSEKAQTLITTHWYGFLPVIDKGIVHFLSNTDGDVNFDKKINLLEYSFQTKKIPKDFSLKSTNDLVQSIFHSLKSDKPYNWIICEGTSDKTYLTYFLKKEIENNNLKIIAVGGISLVKKFYKYLSLPIEENCDDRTKGRVFCLTDTDADGETKDINQKNSKLENSLVIKRLTKEDTHETGLIKFESPNKKSPIDIEQSLSPIIFSKTLVELGVESSFLIDETKIQNAQGNTTIENLENFKIRNYFSSEIIKNTFSKKYIEIMEDEETPDIYVPKWIHNIKDFFNASENKSETLKKEILGKEIDNKEINFQNLVFINRLRVKYGAKGGLIMALRGSELHVIGDILHIKAKTVIAKKQIDNADNKDLIDKAAKDFGISKVIIA